MIQPNYIGVFVKAVPIRWPDGWCRNDWLFVACWATRVPQDQALGKRLQCKSHSKRHERSGK